MKSFNQITVLFLAFMAVPAMALPQPIAGIHVQIDEGVDRANTTDGLLARQNAPWTLRTWVNKDCSGKENFDQEDWYEAEIQTHLSQHSYMVHGEAGCFVAYTKWDSKKKKCSGTKLGQLFNDFCGLIFRPDNAIACFKYVITSECNHP